MWMILKGEFFFRKQLTLREKQTDRNTEIHIERDTDRLRYRLKDMKTHRDTDRQRYRQTEIQTHRDTDRQR
jgi:hypothetical protein